MFDRKANISDNLWEVRSFIMVNKMAELTLKLLFVGTGTLLFLMLPVALIVSTPFILIWPNYDPEKS